MSSIFPRTLLSVIFFGLTAIPAAHACDQTVSSASALLTALNGATSAVTICLANGDYGTVNITNLRKGALVTIRSASGLGARLSPQIVSSSNIRLESLMIADASIRACSSRIQIVGNTWVENTSGIEIYDYGYSCDGSNKQNLIDGNIMRNVRPSWSEGKIGIVQTNGLTISNNLIEGQPVGYGGDGIQSGGSNDNITIGPGNIFRNILQGPCDAMASKPHCDAIQIVGGAPNYTITGNWFDTVEVPLQHHDGTAPVRFTNNLITGGSQIWIYDAVANNSVIEHNTFFNQRFFAFGTNGSGVTTSSGIVVRSNIFMNGDAPNICNGCTVSHNLGTSAGESPGSNAITGTPTFNGGSPGSFSTWAGWRLAANSLGRNNGHDGQDRGTLYPVTGGSNAAPSAPSNLKVSN